MHEKAQRPRILRSVAVTIAGLAGSGLCFGAGEGNRPAIFPAPREIATSGDDFVLAEQVSIVIPAHPSDEDLFVAGTLANEVGDRFGLHLKIERRSALDPN